MRQKIFSASFWVCMVCGAIFFGSLLLAGLNELVLYLFPQVAINIPGYLIDMLTVCLKIVGIGMVVGAPVTLANVLARGIQQDDSGRWIAMSFAVLFICVPLMLQAHRGAWQAFTIYLCVVIFATIIGGGGEKLRIPRYFDR